MSISFHFFPDDWDHDNTGLPSDPQHDPDLSKLDDGRQSLLGIKRLMDVVGSAMLLLLSSPVLLIIAIAVKLTSKGPILFRQQRVGRHGQVFTFLKFRSMYINNDHSVHKDFVRQLIASEKQGKAPHGNGEPVYKLTNDKRITRIGQFLRRTSLDELPQF